MFAGRPTLVEARCSHPVLGYRPRLPISSYRTCDHPHVSNKVMGSMEDPELTGSTIEVAEMPNIPYARGYLERDLHPGSLWSNTTNATVDLTDDTEAAPGDSNSAGLASSSSSGVASASTDVPPPQPLAFVRTGEIKHLAKFF